MKPITVPGSKFLDNMFLNLYLKCEKFKVGYLNWILGYISSLLVNVTFKINSLYCISPWERERQKCIFSPEVRSKYSFWFRMTPLERKDTSTGYTLTVMEAQSICHPADHFYNQDMICSAASYFSWFLFIRVPFRSLGVHMGWLCKLINNLMGSDKSLSRVHSVMIRACRCDHSMLPR